MKKQLRNLLILVGVLAGLLALWLSVTLIPGFGPSDETTAETTKAQTQLLSADPATVARIDVHNNFSDLTLFPDRTSDSNGQLAVTWHLAEDSGFPISQNSLEDLAQAALSVTYTDVIIDNPVDLAAFGLNRPVSTLSLVFKDGTSRTIEFGNTLSSGSGVYARLSQDSHVYAVDTRFKELTSQSLKDLVDLGQFAGGLKSADLASFKFLRRDDQLSLESLVQPNNPDDATAGLTFTLQAPVERAGNSDTLTTVLSSILNLSAVRIVDLDSSDLDRYGLQTPKYQFELYKTGMDPVLVRIGDSAGNGQYYVTSSAIPAILTVQASTLTALDLPLEDYVDRYVAMQNIWQVSDLSLDLAGQHHNVSLDIAKGQKLTDDGVVMTLDGQNAKIVSQSGENLFSSFYQRLIAIKLAGFDLTGVPDAVVTDKITYTLKPDQDSEQAPETPKTMVIEFAPRDAYTDYVLIDGTYAGFFVNHRDVFTSDLDGQEGLEVAISHLQYAIEHAVDGVFDTSKGYLPEP